MNSNVISLSKFLSRYALLEGIDLRKLNHDEVAILFPALKRATFEEIRECREKLYSGNIVLVSDGKKTIPYYVPELEMDKECDFLQVNCEEAPTYTVDYSTHDYASMSEYELRNLLIRKFNSAFNQSKARKELLSRGIPITKKYNRTEFRRIKEEELK